MRVGFVELHSRRNRASELANTTKINGTNGSHTGSSMPCHLERHLEKSWPISNQLKSDNADSLFLWIGGCIAEVVEQGCKTLELSTSTPLPLGITFSFPVEQPSLEKAIITSMGKGFAIPPKIDLGARLEAAYEKHRGNRLPQIRVAAIANDSVATLVSFIFNHSGVAQRRATMGLILGTGSNATIPIRPSRLHPSKRPQKVTTLRNGVMEDAKIAVNTEWSINGSAPPMRDLGLISSWDDELSAQNEKPGFQPLEYMTAGRYLGELGRLMLLDYMTNNLGIASTSLPCKMLEQFGLTTKFLGQFKPPGAVGLLTKLRDEFGTSADADFAWTEHHAHALHRIAKSIERRAAGLIAAAILALLTLGDELPAEDQPAYPNTGSETLELGVGYTGGCIVHFQDYLTDCQGFLDELIHKRFGTQSRVRVVLSPCHDGGISGAGILAAAASAAALVNPA